MPESFNPVLPETMKSETELRRERFLASLENLEKLELADIYPPELEVRQWDRLTVDEDIEKFFVDSYGKALDTMRVGSDLDGLAVFQDKETGQLFAAPGFMKKEGPPDITVQPLLDLLFTAKRIAPWSKFVSVGLDSSEQYFTSQRAGWTMTNNHLIINVKELEILVNILGDPRYSLEQKHDTLRDELGTVVHESVHVTNAQEGAYDHSNIIGEIAPTTVEYLIFPGKNMRLEKLANDAVDLLVGNVDKKGSYRESLLLGMLLLSDREGLLGEDDDRERLVEGIKSWRDKIRSLNGQDLAVYRQQVEELMLSDEDIKIRTILGRLLRKYPTALSHLVVVTK